MEALLLLILIFCLVLAVYFVFAIVGTCYFLCRGIKRIDEESRHPVDVPAPPPGQAEVSGQVAKATTCARTRIYPDLEKLNQKLITPSIPGPGNAILTSENEKSDMEHSQKRLYPSLENVATYSNISKCPVKLSSSKEEETRISKTTRCAPSKLPSTTPDPRKVIFTIENEESESSKKQEVKRNSKTSRSLPWSAKAKHLYPKCKSASQACR